MPLPANQPAPGAIGVRPRTEASMKITYIEPEGGIPDAPRTIDVPEALLNPPNPTCTECDYDLIDIDMAETEDGHKYATGTCPNQWCTGRM